MPGFESQNKYNQNQFISLREIRNHSNGKVKRIEAKQDSCEKRKYQNYSQKI